MYIMLFIGSVIELEFSAHTTDFICISLKPACPLWEQVVLNCRWAIFGHYFTFGAFEVVNLAVSAEASPIKHLT